MFERGEKKRATEDQGGSGSRQKDTLTLLKLPRYYGNLAAPGQASAALVGSGEAGVRVVATGRPARTRFQSSQSTPMPNFLVPCCQLRLSQQNLPLKDQLALLPFDFLPLPSPLNFFSSKVFFIFDPVDIQDVSSRTAEGAGHAGQYYPISPIVAQNASPSGSPALRLRVFLEVEVIASARNHRRIPPHHFQLIKGKCLHLLEMSCCLEMPHGRCLRLITALRKICQLAM